MNLRRGAATLSYIDWLAYVSPVLQFRRCIVKLSFRVSN
jgi:hypothetical protein